jgi:uncharacterized protein (TIGR00255 family)
MAIASMTGFARVSGSSGPYQWAWEIRSVNGRGLDVRFRGPGGYDSLGEEARQQIARALSRGQCQLSLAITRGSVTPRVRINREVLAALVEALRDTGVPEPLRPPSLDSLLAIRGVVEVDENAEDGTLEAELLRELREAVPRLIEALVEARHDEGRALAQVIVDQLVAMERLVNAAEAYPGRRPEAVRARLEAQVAQLIETAAALDPDRLHQEAILIASRADIREELDRLRAHVASARELVEQGGTVGRRLDFLAQEFGRESNTLCAKAIDVTLSRIGLDLKAVVEQFREQVQNVE